jgi:ankyrin repeat protein
VDHADANMMRAVHVACINGQPEILELLLKQGASTDVCDNDGLMVRCVNGVPCLVKQQQTAYQSK